MKKYIFVEICSRALARDRRQRRDDDQDRHRRARRHRVDARNARRRRTPIKTKTADRVEIKYYPGGVMGDEPAVLRKIKIGQLQGGAFTGGELSAVDQGCADLQPAVPVQDSRTKSTRCAPTSIRCSRRVSSRPASTRSASAAAASRI